MIKFGGVRIADEEVVNNKRKRGGVGVVAGKHGGGGFGVAVLGKKGDKTQLAVGTRDQIGGGQGQFSEHHRREKVCRGSDGGKEEGQVL